MFPVSESPRRLRIVRDDTPPSAGSRRPRQWSIGALLLLTTVVAIALAGFLRQGFEGAIGAVFLSWMVVFGSLAVVYEILRSPRSIGQIFVASAVAALGVYGWLVLLQTAETSTAEALARFSYPILGADLWRKVLLACVLALVIWFAVRPKWAVRIVADADGVRLLAGVPRSKRQTVLDFLTRELAIQDRVTIRALRQPDGYLRLQVRGLVEPGAEQQVRNFLNTVI